MYSVTKSRPAINAPGARRPVQLVQRPRGFLGLPQVMHLWPTTCPPKSPCHNDDACDKKEEWLQDDVTITQSIRGRNPTNLLTPPNPSKLLTPPNPTKLLTFSSHPPSAFPHIIKDSSGTPHKAIPSKFKVISFCGGVCTPLSVVRGSVEGCVRPSAVRGSVEGCVRPLCCSRFCGGVCTPPLLFEVLWRGVYAPSVVRGSVEVVCTPLGRLEFCGGGMYAPSAVRDSVEGVCTPPRPFGVLWRGV